MSILSLCTGVGGMELGLKLACPSSRTICYCEREAYCVQILVARIKEGILDDAPIWSDIKTFDGKPWRGKVDCIVGSLPCQPFSVAGKKLQDRDERYLWPDCKRIIEEVQPSRVFFENVELHLSLGFEKVIYDLEAMGYTGASGIFTAYEVGSPHPRSRLFALAYSKCLCSSRRRTVNDLESETGNIKENKEEWKWLRDATNDSSNDILRAFPPNPQIAVQEPWPQPILDRAINGFPNRMDRLRVLGNAVVPLVAAYAWRVLEESLATGE